MSDGPPGPDDGCMQTTTLISHLPARIAGAILTTIGVVLAPAALHVWTEAADDRSAWAMTMANTARARFKTGEQTDLIGAIESALDRIAGTGSRGTIIIISDGMHSLRDPHTGFVQTIGGEELVDRVRSQMALLGLPPGGIAIHTVGLFDWPSVLESSQMSPRTVDAVRAALTQRRDAGGSLILTSSMMPISRG